MTAEITLEDIVKLKEQFDMANVPTKGRIVHMSKEGLRAWCEATGLKWEDVEYKELGHNIVEVGL
jgi:hypothetical protein